MRTLLPTIILALVTLTSRADELVTLETYHRDNWVHFSQSSNLYAFLDSSGAIYVSYSLIRESEWPQTLLRCYPPGEPARGGDVTLWGPGSWWGPRVCKIDGDDIEIQMGMGTDFYPMPIAHKLMFINHSNQSPLEEKYTRIVVDTELSHLRRTSDSTASSFGVDFAIWEQEVVRFLSNIRLYNSHQYDSLPLVMEADTLWESPSSNSYIKDAKIKGENIHSGLYNRYSHTTWGFVCLSNNEVIVEIDSLFPASISDLGLRAIGSLFMFTWREGDAFYYQTFSPADTSFSETQVYYTEGESSLNSRINTRLGVDDIQFYRQTPVLNDFSSSSPQNWHSIIRQTISRDDLTITSVDTVFTFDEPPMWATHNFAIKNGELHSLIVADEGPLSHLYYFGPLNLVSIDEPVESPKKFALSKPFPNPFNGQVQIELQTPTQMDLQISIFDTRGREVYSQKLRNQPPGSLDLIWSGKNNSGLTLSSGMYVLHVEGQHYSASQKVVLLK